MQGQQIVFLHLWQILQVCECTLDRLPHGMPYGSRLCRGTPAVCSLLPFPLVCTILTCSGNEDWHLHLAPGLVQRFKPEPPLYFFTVNTGSPPPLQLSRPQTPSELQTSHEADDTWYAEHSQREPVRHAPVESSKQYARYVEEYDVKHEAYLQIHQAIRRTQRYLLSPFPRLSATFYI